MNSSWRRRPAPTTRPRTLPDRPTSGITSSTPASTALTDKPVAVENGRRLGHATHRRAERGNSPSPLFEVDRDIRDAEQPDHRVGQPRRRAEASRFHCEARSLPSITSPSSSLRILSACFTQATSSPMIGRQPHTSRSLSDRHRRPFDRERDAETERRDGHAEHRGPSRLGETDPHEEQRHDTGRPIAPSTVRDDFDVISETTSSRAPEWKHQRDARCPNVATAETG